MNARNSSGSAAAAAAEATAAAAAAAASSQHPTHAAGCRPTHKSGPPQSCCSREVEAAGQ